jgi:hypothetical protein
MEKISNVPEPTEPKVTMTRRDFIGKVSALVTATTFLPISFDQNMEIMLDHQKTYSAEKADKDSYRILRDEYPNIYRKPALHENNVFVNHPTLGKVATDGFSITHSLDSSDGKYKPLEKNEFLDVSPKERMSNVLSYLINYEYGKANPDKTIMKTANPYNIDPMEVEKYRKSKEGEEERFESFVIAKNAKGEPCLVIATDPYSKLNKVNGAADAVGNAIKKLNEYDPNIMDVITRDNLVRVISGNAALFKLDKTSIIHPRGGAVIIDHNLVKNRPNDDMSVEEYYALIILLQSRRLGNLRSIKENADGSKEMYMKDQVVNNNAPIDAQTWLLKWLKEVGNNIPKSVRDKYVIYATRNKSEMEEKYRLWKP